MWGNSDFFQRILTNALTNTVDNTPEMKDAEEVAKRIGVAECNYCKMEIWYHPEMISAGWTWESEDLVGWCNASKTSRHQPRIREKEKEE